MTILFLTIFSILYNIPHVFMTSNSGRNCNAYGKAGDLIHGELYYWFSFILNFILPFVLLLTHHNMYSYVGETEKSEDVSTTDLENSSLIVNVSSTAGDMTTISSTAGDVLTNPGDGDDESMAGDETPMTSGVDGSDHTYASHGDGTRDYPGDSDNEARDQPNNPGDDAQENNITNKSTLGSRELFSATSVDTVPETPPEEQNRGATPEIDVVGDDTLTDKTMTKTSKGKKTKTHAALVVGGGDGE